MARNKLTNIKAPPRQVGKRRIPQTSVIQHHPSSLSTYSTGWTWLPGLKLGTGPNLFMPDMVDARRAHMPGISHLLAISCLLILCPCNHSLESCKNSKIEHKETSNLMTRLAQQFQINVSTEREALPLQIPKKCFAILL